MIDYVLFPGSTSSPYKFTIDEIKMWEVWGVFLVFKLCTIKSEIQIMATLLTVEFRVEIL